MFKFNSNVSSPIHKKHRGLHAIGSVLLDALLLVGGYLLYIVLQYRRIPDAAPLSVKDSQTSVLRQKDTYCALSFNIGFGAYDPDFSFFMSTGTMTDGTPTRGAHAKATSKMQVKINTAACAAITKEQNVDFALLQETDMDGTRSFHVNQVAEITAALPGYGSVYASNFHTAFLAYPLHDMHGKTEAGLLSFSRYRIDEAVRRSYPVDNAFPTRFFDLDRCFSMLRVPVWTPSGADAGKQLVLINSHMSAYDKGGTIRVKQLAMLNHVMTQEYQKGNYVIVGGDFNHALYGTINHFPSKQQKPSVVYGLESTDFPMGFSVVMSTNGLDVPTCRASDIPYEKGVTYTSVLDGFIVSDNVQATTKNIDYDFKYSDHNPVLLSFSLMP